MPDLESRPAAVHTVSVKARLAAAGLRHGAARPGSPSAPDGGEHASARVAEARSRARERGDRQRQALRPLGVVFLAVVVTASAQAHPAPGLRGAGLAVAVVLAVYAAAVATAVSVGWAPPAAAPVPFLRLLQNTLLAPQSRSIASAWSRGTAVPARPS